MIRLVAVPRQMRDQITQLMERPQGFREMADKAFRKLHTE